MEHHSFIRRSNDDATIDSICSRCFATVGPSLQQADLERAEQNHICNPSRAEHFRGLSKAVEEYRTGRKDDEAPEI